MLPDCGAVERAVRHKAVDESLDIAAVERRRVAHEQIADREPVFDFGEGHGFVWRLFDRNKDGVPDLVFDVIGEVALTGRVLDKDYVAGRDEPAFAVARGDLHPGVEIDDVLPPRRRVPIDIVLGLGLAKDRSEEHTSELQSRVDISYAVFCLNNKQCELCYLSGSPRLLFALSASSHLGR